MASGVTSWSRQRPKTATSSSSITKAPGSAGDGLLVAENGFFKNQSLDIAPLQCLDGLDHEWVAPRRSKPLFVRPVLLVFL